MDLKKLAIAPALIALGLYAASATYAGQDNTDTTAEDGTTPGGDGHAKQEDGDTPTAEEPSTTPDETPDETPVAGGDDNDNGGEHSKADPDPENPDPENPGTGVDPETENPDPGVDPESKNPDSGVDPEPQEPENPGKNNPDPVPDKPVKPVVVTSHGGGGGNDSEGYPRRKVRCYVNGQIFYVFTRSQCGPRYAYNGGGGGDGGGYVVKRGRGQGGGYARQYRYTSGGYYVVVKRKQQRRGRVMVQQYVGGADAGYGYTYQQPRRIRYYSPASPAAVMQAEKRAGKAVRYAAEAYGSGGGYVYANGGGYAGDGYYGEQRVKVRKHGKYRKHHGQRMVMQQPDYGYEGGYCDPMSKNGGY